MPVITRLIQIEEAADITAPILTVPTATATGQTTASGSVTTDEGNGTLYFLASVNATELAATVVSTGSSQAVTSTGSQGVIVTGLVASTQYYLHFVHVDEADNSSTRVTSSPFTTSASDVTAPILSSPIVTTVTATTASGSVTTDEGNGTLYFLASVNATELAATVVTTGQSQTVTASGIRNVTLTGLTSSTSYYVHFVHVDTIGNTSTRVTSAQFTTGSVITRNIRISAAADLVAPILSSPIVTTVTATTASGSVTTDEGNGTLYFLASVNATELAATVVTTGQSQTVTASGIRNVTLTGLTSSTSYYVHFVHRDAAGNTSTRVTSAQFTTGEGVGGAVITRTIQILPEALVITNLTSARIGNVNTINTQGVDLQTSGTVSVRLFYNNTEYPLFNTTVTSSSTVNVLFPIDRLPLGGSCSIIVTAGSKVSEPFVFTMGSAYSQGSYTTLSVPFSGLHPDSPLNDPIYESLIIPGTQVDFTGVTSPSGFTVTLSQTGLLTVTGASPSNYDQRVTFALVQPSVNQFQRSTEGIWVLDTPTPNALNTTLDNITMSVSGGNTTTVSGEVNTSIDDIVFTSTGSFAEGQQINGFLTTGISDLTSTITGNLESATGNLYSVLGAIQSIASGVVAATGAVPIRFRLKYLKVIEM